MGQVKVVKRRVRKKGNGREMKEVGQIQGGLIGGGGRKCHILSVLGNFFE
jgi:hypothetical protein